MKQKRVHWIRGLFNSSTKLYYTTQNNQNKLYMVIKCNFASIKWKALPFHLICVQLKSIYFEIRSGKNYGFFWLLRWNGFSFESMRIIHWLEPWARQCETQKLYRLEKCIPLLSCIHSAARRQWSLDASKWRLSVAGKCILCNFRWCRT